LLSSIGLRDRIRSRSSIRKKFSFPRLADASIEARWESASLHLEIIFVWIFLDIIIGVINKRGASSVIRTNLTGSRE
jgi:hypothetical protein